MLCCWNLGPLCMSISRKVALSWLMSYVNFIVGWKLLRSCIKLFSLSSPWVQGAKMSSIYRIHVCGLYV